MTASQKLLLAVADAVGDDLGTQLTETNMAVICWRRFPADFGIISDPELPDTKRFSRVLHIGQGNLKTLVARVRKGRYSLTVEGVAEAERLRTGSSQNRDRSESESDESYFARIVDFLRWRVKPQSAKTIGKALGIPRGSLSQILYRSHRDSFVSSVATGYARNRVWALSERLRGEL